MRKEKNRLSRRQEKGGIAAGRRAAAVVLLAGTMAFSACGAASSGVQAELPEPASAFTLDYESGDFSFISEEEVKRFYVRVFPEGQNGENEDDMPLAARRVRYHTDQTEYEGVLDLAGLTAGDRYDAYVFSYVKDENGDLVYSMSDPVSGVYKTTYDTPEEGFYCVKEDGSITVLLQNAFFTDQFLQRDPDFLINLYQDGELVDSALLKHEDIDIEVTVTNNPMRGEVKTTKAHGQTTFVPQDPKGEYSASIQVISTDDTAFYDSEESEKVSAISPEEVPEETEAAGSSGEGGAASDEPAGEEGAAGEAGSGEEGAAGEAGSGEEGTAGEAGSGEEGAAGDTALGE